MGIEPQVGRVAVARAEEDYPEDAESLQQSQIAFTRAYDDAYLQCLKDRRPDKLEKKAKMKRATVLEFFRAYIVTLNTPRFREQLEHYVEQHGSMPNKILKEVHEEVTELLGFDRAHGQKCFADLGAFVNDREVAMAYKEWKSKISSICLDVLKKHMQAGGELNVSAEEKKVLQEQVEQEEALTAKAAIEKSQKLQAQEAVSAMSQDERVKLMEKNAKKLRIVQGLPEEARLRYLAKLSDEEKTELAQTEMISRAAAHNGA